MGYHILIIDSTTRYIPTFREAFEGKNEKYYFSIYENFATAKTQFVNHTLPDLILFNFDSVNGKKESTIKTINSDSDFNQIPLMVYSQENHTAEAFNEGAKDYIKAPIEEIELFLRAKNLISNQKNRTEKELEFRNLELRKERIREKTINLFGKNMDLKLAKKAIEEQNRILEIKKEKIRKKTINLFGKIRDLKIAKNEIEQQKKYIQQQNDEITSSINYASIIQQAILPREHKIRKHYQDLFVLNLPKDIVSGDFFFFEAKGDDVFLSVADCTGHGVPAGFLSMLGITLLQEIINKDGDHEPGLVLNKLNAKIINILHQTSQQTETKDGMDLAFTAYNKKTKKLKFAGAFNPALVYRDGKIIEMKGQRMPIGFLDGQIRPFKTKEMDMKENDVLYMFTDGYVDQFGHENNKKFMYPNFYKLIKEVGGMPLEKQKEAFHNTFSKWKGNLPQLDDILILGVKF